MIFLEAYFNVVYFGAATGLVLLTVRDWRRVDPALRRMNARPLAFGLNGVVRIALVGGLVAGSLLPPLVHLLPIVCVAVASVVVSTPGPFLALTGGPRPGTVPAGKRGDAAQAAPALADDELLAKTLVDKAIAAQALGRLDMEIAVAADVVGRFGASESTEVRRQVAIALIGRGNALTLKGDDAGAIEAYEEVERRFGRESSTGLQREVADALVEKAALWAQTGRSEDAVKSCNLVVERYQRSADPDLRKYVHQARSIKRACEEG